MSPSPAGWYPDPSTTPPGTQPGLRWWDGSTWTAHTHAVPEAAPEQYQPTPYQPTPYQPTQYPAAPPAYQGSPYGQPAQLVNKNLTPDGQQLASWGRRLAAYLLDGVLTFLVTLVASAPFLSQIIDYVSSVVDDVSAQLDAGVQDPVLPTEADMMSALWQPFLAITIIGLMVSLAYHAGFLKWRGATPAKMLLGIEVRLREQPGPLSWGTVLIRWAGQFGVGIVQLLPGIGVIAGFYPLLDGLWPLWDGKKQALHDKMARTNVVRTR
ncbi:putative RDD domain containing protein [metagenome]|uniref:Putative RDD domain containing protein n=1 Tax=metagenome TaxID=256318 RepID=A0A2P2CBW3_9ZZZZ